MKLTIVPLTPALTDDLIATVNAYTASWPFSRPINGPLVDHWRNHGFRDDQVLMLRDEGQTLACLHWEDLGETWQIHLLAVRPEVTAEIASPLLAEFCSRARSAGAKRVVGPNSRTMAFYGGFVLGNEPYHPHFATTVTDVYIRNGFHVSHPAVILVAPTGEGSLDPVPDGYEVVRAAPPPEYDAQTFGFHAMGKGKKAAHCYARLYPHLTGPAGTPVGQIGNVTTEAEHRNRGLARCLVKMALQRLQDMGAADVLIATGLENYPALRAYERCGFKRRHFIIEWSRALQTQ